MADIQLTADGSQAIQTLQKIQDNVTKLQSGFGKFAKDTTKNLDSVKKSTEGLNGAISKLGGLLASLAIGSFITRAVAMADAMNDLSDATGIAMNEIIGFSNAVSLSGGTAEGAQKAILKLVQNVGEAASGSATLQSSFRDVGISLNDLANLSEGDILKKTIEGLAKITDNAERSALAANLLGKEFRNVSIGQLNSMLAQSNTNAIKSAEAFKAAAEAQDRFDRAIISLKTNLLIAIQPITDFIAKLEPEQIERFTKAVVDIGVGLTALAGAVKVFNLVGAAIAAVGGYLVMFHGGLRMAKTGVTMLAAAYTSLSGTMKGVIAGIIANIAIFASGFVDIINSTASLEEKFTALQQKILYVVLAIGSVVAGFALFKAGAGAAILGILGGFARMLPLIGVIVTAVGILNEVLKAAFNINIIDIFIDGLKSAWNWMGKLVDKGREMVGLGKKAEPQPARTAADFQRLDKDRTPVPLPKAAGALREVQDAMAKQRQAVEDISKNYRLQNADLNAQAQLQASLVGLSEEQREQVEARYAIEKQYRDVMKDLQNRLNNLTADEKKAGLAEALNKQMKEVTAEYAKQIPLTADNVTKLQTARLLEQDRLRTIEHITQQIDKQIEQQKALGEAIRTATLGAQERLNDVMFEGAQMKRSPLQRQIAQIEEDGRRAALEAGRAFAASFGDDELTAERSKQLADGLSDIAKRYREITDAQLENLRISRSWSQGWNDAFNEYMDSATNAAKIAGSVFNSITGNMERMIDRFVDTGKLSFGDFAKSIIQDLIKIELKAQAMSLWKMMSGGNTSSAGAGFGGSLVSGIGSWLGGLLGFANGGQPPLNKPSIVGERGPELFMPRSAGTIIPNGGFGGTSQPTQQIVNNTYITNQVSALDAKSVSQLLQENKRMLFGIVESARRELPMGAR